MREYCCDREDTANPFRCFTKCHRALSGVLKTHASDFALRHTKLETIVLSIPFRAPYCENSGEIQRSLAAGSLLFLPNAIACAEPEGDNGATLRA